MSNIVIFNTTTNRITDYIEYVNTPDYEGRPDVLINPDVATLITAGIPFKYWKHVAGQVIEMSQPEKDAVDTEISGAETASIVSIAKTQMDGLSPLPLALRAFAYHDLADHNRIKQAFNALLTWLGTQTTLTNRNQLPAMAQTEFTLAQLKIAIKNEIDAGTLNDQ